MMFTEIVAFVFGAIVGSFLNVCIYRLPLGESVVWPGSHCPVCSKRIPWYDNIPFVSYILLAGRCRFCKEKISLRYLLVELLTGFMFVFLLRKFALSYAYFVALTFVCLLIIASFIDIKHRIIPDEISLGGVLLGFLLSLGRSIHIHPLSFNYRVILDSFLGILVGGLTIYLFGKAFDLVYFRLLKRPPIQGETESIGGGDVKFLALIGAFLGWKGALMTFFLAPFFGAIFGIANLLIKKDHTIPYGPFLAIAAVVYLFWADKILSFLFVTNFIK